MPHAITACHNPALAAVVNLSLTGDSTTGAAWSKESVAPTKLAGRLLACPVANLLIIESSDDIPTLEKFLLSLNLDSLETRPGILLLLQGDSQNLSLPETVAKTVDEILQKPFRSEHIREACERICKRTAEKTAIKTASAQSEVKSLLLISDAVPLRSIISTLLEAVEVDFTACNNAQEAKQILAHQRFALTIVANRDQSLTVENEISYQLNMGTLYLSANTPPKNMPSAAQFIKAPLNQKVILEILSRHPQLLPEGERAKLDDIRLSPGEQSLLAARISASVYERLLTQSPLSGGKWVDAADVALAETLRICEEFEKLIRRR
ncbi:MAG: hypothetical protein PHC51_04990 [bacterium]|nr:hypothetical protein [bacterium]